MAVLTWVLLLYGLYIIVWVCTFASRVWFIGAMAYAVLTFMAIWAHIKTMFTDPGSVPRNAQPLAKADSGGIPSTICGRCDAYKPPRAHHCSICGRCIVRMDHHCPWMNSCIGALNQKHFFLFLGYTLAASFLALAMLVYHFWQCRWVDWQCLEYGRGMVRLAMALPFVAVAAIIFTFSMIMNQAQGVLTGVGTVDRMQRRRKKRIRGRPEDFGAVRWKDVFGCDSKLMWFLPVDPHFQDRDQVLGFITPSSEPSPPDYPEEYEPV